MWRLTATKQTEQLHIDFTKDAYRTTNQKDEYPQMTAWLERREKIQQHAAYINWWQHASLEDRCSLHLLGPLCPETWIIQMTQHPTRRAVLFNNLAYHYGAINFQDALALFITFTNHPSTLAVALSGLAADMLIPFCSVPVYHKIKFTSSTSDQAQIVDVVHVQPELKDTRGHPILSCFDTVIVCGRRSHAGVQENDGQLLSC